MNRRLHQIAIGTSLLLDLLILLNVVAELVHLTLFVLGLLLALLALPALPTGLVLVIFVLAVVVAVMVEDALHKVLVVGLVGSYLIAMRRVRNCGGMNGLGMTDLQAY